MDTKPMAVQGQAARDTNIPVQGHFQQGVLLLAGRSSQELWRSCWTPRLLSHTLGRQELHSSRGVLGTGASAAWGAALGASAAAQWGWRGTEPAGLGWAGTLLAV